MKSEVMPTISAVKVSAPGQLIVSWSGGQRVDLDLTSWLEDKALAPLRRLDVFEAVQVGDWGHSLTWPGEIEIGADSLWRETLSVLQSEDARRFLEWRLKHGLSLDQAAEALGLSRRMVAYYCSGEHAVPRRCQFRHAGDDRPLAFGDHRQSIDIGADQQRLLLLQQIDQRARGLLFLEQAVGGTCGLAHRQFDGTGYDGHV